MSHPYLQPIHPHHVLSGNLEQGHGWPLGSGIGLGYAQSAEWNPGIGWIDIIKHMFSY